MRLIAFMLFVIGSSITFAAPSNSQAPLPGGYVDANVTDPKVLEAANFAAQQLNAATLIKVVKAQTQVVSGLNYKMRLELADVAGKQATYDVIVFVPLPVMNAPMQLTSAAMLENPPQTSPNP